MDRPKYAFLMVDYETPAFIKDLHSKIPEEELYFIDDDKSKYGCEKKTHITIVPCIDNKSDLEKMKKYIEPLEQYKVLLTNISKFECEEYDVLKASATSMILNDTNRRIKDEFDTFSEHSEYSPHVTIAYMKKGMADKYLCSMLTPLVVLTPKNFHYSWYDENGKENEVVF